MAELTIKEKEDEDDETEGLAAMEKEGLSRKEKRKALKNAKRKQARRERAAKERLEAEARLNDPAEQARLSLAEQEEAERSRRERAEFEARERAWLAAMEESQRRKALEEEEERRRKALDDEASRMSQQVGNTNEGDESDGDWEYVEEGPPEIIWQGNEIILKKKMIRVSKKKEPDESIKNVDAERPTSNPFPPESEASAEYRNSSATGQDLIGSVALQVPNFGTEQDKAHCPFHLKTGVCRFGQRCSRVHFYPDKSCTLLIKNMYNGPGLAWEQDEGLEYTDEEVERCYEEFYEDVHTEFLKFGEIINFKVCRNGSFHLRGNVYVHFKSLDSAVLAYHSVNGRYFAGKQLSCEFVNVTRWKVAICGEYTKTRFKTCSRGTACNFIHCFRNPGGDYEWADSDKPPPRYWVKKMIALFGYSDDSSNERHTVQGNLDQPTSSGKISSADAERYHSRRSRSRERDYLHRRSSTRKNDNSLDDNIPAKRKNDNKDYVQSRRYQLRCRNDDKDKINALDEDVHEDSMTFKDGLRRKRKTHDADTGESFDDDRGRSLDGFHDRAKKSSRWNSRDNKDDFHDLGFNGDWLAREGEKERGYGYTSKSSKYQRAEKLGDYEDHERENCKVNRDWRGKGRDEAGYHDSRKNTPRHSRKVRNPSDHRDKKRGSRDADREWSDKDSDGDRHSSMRKSSLSYGKTDNSSDNCDRESYSYGIIGISCEWLDKDRTNKVSELSDDEGEQAKRLNIRGDHSRKEIIETDSWNKSLRSDRNNDSSCSSKYDEQYRLYDLDSRCSSDLEIGKLDRWEPEKFSERHEKHITKDSTTPRSPGQYERDKSCDKYSELYHDRHQKS